MNDYRAKNPDYEMFVKDVFGRYNVRTNSEKIPRRSCYVIELNTVRN